RRARDPAVRRGRGARGRHTRRHRFGGPRPAREPRLRQPGPRPRSDRAAGRSRHRDHAVDPRSGPRLPVRAPRGLAQSRTPGSAWSTRRGDHLREPPRGLQRGGRDHSGGPCRRAHGPRLRSHPWVWHTTRAPRTPIVSPDSISALRLSLQVAVAATALNALIGIPIAYLLARRRFWGKSLADLLVTLPLILPPPVVGYYLIVLLGRRGLLGRPLYELTGWTVAFTWYAAVIAATVMALPLLVRTVRAAIESVDRDLERAAYTLGRSELRTALEVTLPLARNGILAGMVLAFARALGEVRAPLMLAETTTVPRSIYTAVQTGESGEAVALVAALTALSCVVLIAANRLGARAA